MLYDFVICPHRVLRDIFGDNSERNEISPFTRLLWERGHAFEREVIEGLDIPYLDFSELADEERERRTLEAMQNRETLIYGGRIRFGDLLGEPDLLRHDGSGYIAGDIKSGAGEEAVSGSDARKPKKHYAVQLSLYTDILERLGLSSGRHAFVWDIHGEEVVYDLASARGPKSQESLWDIYIETLESAREIASRANEPLPAICSGCKQCHWRTACRKQLDELDDLTLIPGIGRSKRDGLLPHVATVQDLVSFDIQTLISKGNKTIVAGIGASTLKKAKRRAALLKTEGATPYLTTVFEPIDAPIEIFFDVEVDPFRDICYLHGFIERRNGDTAGERYLPFFAANPSRDAELQAFGEAVDYLRQTQPAAIYYFSKYERTIWRSLRARFPDVATEEEIEEIFSAARSIDLYYDVVSPTTEWPTNDYSIKTLAKYLGFTWRDTDPSGAASIEWYDNWVKSGDVAVRQRILEYNEDDCRATRVLLDGLCRLPLASDASK